VSLSITEVEYIEASVICAQILWKKQILIDYGIMYSTSPILWDNTSSINLSNNHISIHVLRILILDIILT